MIKFLIGNIISLLLFFAMTGDHPDEIEQYFDDKDQIKYLKEYQKKHQKTRRNR